MAAPIITEFNTTPGPGRTTLVEVLGSGFGSSQDSSFLRIGDTIAVVTFWSDVRVTGYVPNTVINQLARSHKQLKDIGQHTHDEIDQHIDDNSTAHGLNSKIDKIVGGTAGDFVAIGPNSTIVDSSKKAADFAPIGHTHPGISFEFVDDEIVIASALINEYTLPSIPALNSEFIFHNGIRLTRGSDRDFILLNDKIRFTSEYMSEVGLTPGDGIQYKFMRGQ